MLMVSFWILFDSEEIAIIADAGDSSAIIAAETNRPFVK